MNDAPIVTVTIGTPVSTVDVDRVLRALGEVVSGLTFVEDRQADGIALRGDLAAAIDLSAGGREAARLIMAVCLHFGCSEKDIAESQKKSHPPTLFAMWAAKEILGLSYQKAAVMCRRGDHTTAMNAHRRVSDLLEAGDLTMTEAAAAVSAALGNPRP